MKRFDTDEALALLGQLRDMNAAYAELTHRDAWTDQRLLDEVACQDTYGELRGTVRDAMHALYRAGETGVDDGEDSHYYDEPSEGFREALARVGLRLQECEECGAMAPEGVHDSHDAGCSLHPDNVIDQQPSNQED